MESFGTYGEPPSEPQDVQCVYQEAAAPTFDFSFYPPGKGRKSSWPMIGKKDKSAASGRGGPWGITIENQACKFARKQTHKLNSQQRAPEAAEEWRVLKVYPGGQADKLGARRGDTLAAWDGVPIDDENANDVWKHINAIPC